METVWAGVKEIRRACVRTILKAICPDILLLPPFPVTPDAAAAALLWLFVMNMRATAIEVTVVASIRAAMWAQSLT